MTMKSITDELRSRLASIEGHQVELLSERDEISYLALIEKQPEAIKRLVAINSEIENLKTQAASIEPALRESARRETAAAEEVKASKRRSDAAAAEVALGEAEELASEIDRAMAALKTASVAFEAKMTEVRRLSGSGPQHFHLRGLFARAISTGLRGLPQHPDLLAPSERKTVQGITALWAEQVRNRINETIQSAVRAA
jgi:hypothetical protein